MFPIEILGRIGDFLHVEQYLNLSSCNSSLYENVRNYSEFSLPMSKYQRETYNYLLSETKVGKHVYDIPFSQITVPIFNYIIKKAENEKILLVDSEYKCRLWEKVLSRILGNKVRYIVSNEDIEPDICIILLSSVNLDIMKMFHYSVYILYDNNNDYIYYSVIPPSVIMVSKMPMKQIRTLEVNSLASPQA